MKPSYNTPTSDVWLTPKHIVKALGQFDLDPAGAPVASNWQLAKRTFRMERGQNGLEMPWKGRVWLNPPWSQARLFVAKLAEHQTGVALLRASLETSLWTKVVWPKATCVLLLLPRLCYLLPDGSPGPQPVGQSALCAFSKSDAQLIQQSGLSGVLLRSWRLQ